MKRFWLSVAASAAVAACGDGTNPFTPTATTTTTTSTVPANIAGNLESFTYDAASQTLVVSGTALDNTPYEATYTRKPALDRNGYEAYTSQESSLGRHYTAFVKEVDGTRAGVVVSGAQFGHYFGGAYYERDGDFDPPDTTVAGGIVHYAGSYVGVTNIAGDGGDLLAVTPGTNTALLPRDAAEVIGDIFITADFSDNTTDGVIYNRTVPDYAASVEDLELAPAAIATDGTFSGEVQQSGGSATVGEWAGIFGGTDSSAVAGTVFVSDHTTTFSNEEEYGTFVLNQCGTAGASAVCTQPVP